MKAVAIFGLMIFGAILVSQSAWAGERSWDFEDPKQANEWEVINGTWEIQEGVYKEIAAAEKAAHAYVGDENWEDYNLEAKVRIDGLYAGLVFRAISEFEYYVFYVELTPKPERLCFFKHVLGAGPGARQSPLMEGIHLQRNKADISGEDFARGEWLTMKIAVEGNKFTCFLNDKEIGVGTDDLGNEYKKGKVGVWAWTTRASFDDLKVYGPDIESVAVDSRNKLAIAWGKLKQTD